MICQGGRAVQILKALQGFPLDAVTEKRRNFNLSLEKTYTNFKASNISLLVCDRRNQDLENHYKNILKLLNPP